jgi:hypothetical protein
MHHSASWEMEHERYTRQVFQVRCIAKHVTKNIQNIVISDLKFIANVIDVPQNMDHFVVVPYLLQLSQQSMMAQPYCTFDDAPRPMGYGLP